VARKKAVETFNNEYYMDKFINELCAGERNANTRKRPDPPQWTDKMHKDMLYNSMRFILL
jgi:hypothetical protein